MIAALLIGLAGFTVLGAVWEGCCWVACRAGAPKPNLEPAVDAVLKGLGWALVAFVLVALVLTQLALVCAILAALWSLAVWVWSGGVVAVLLAVVVVVLLTGRGK